MKYHDLEKISKSYGDAFYFLDSNRFRNNFIELKDSFRKYYSNFNIAYSYKTNYTPKLCKIVNELGGYAEVVSEMELEIAIKLGIKYENIIWNGPLKNKKALKTFLLNGGLLNIDNEEEYNYVLEIIGDYQDKVFNLGIRCNFDVQDGVISRFGVDVESDLFQTIIKTLDSRKNVNFIGLQCHFAKRQLEYWEPRIKGILDVVDKIGVIPKRIDIGGGLYGKMPKEMTAQFSVDIPSYEDYAKVVGPIIYEKFKNLPDDERPELIIEPGTALVGDCMSFVGKITSIKNIRNKYFATMLGSKFNINMSGINPPTEIYHRSKEICAYNSLDIVGFTCIEGDVLYSDYKGEIGVGDFVRFNNAGSYSIVMKPPFILPNFPIIEVVNDEVEVIKKMETFEDIFHTFVF